VITLVLVLGHSIENRFIYQPLKLNTRKRDKMAVVWKCGKSLSLVFDISSQSKLKLIDEVEK